MKTDIEIAQSVELQPIVDVVILLFLLSLLYQSGTLAVNL